MCLEFLFHRDEDSPQHNQARTRHNNSGEQKNDSNYNYYPDKNDPPSKPRYSPSDPSTNGSDHHPRIMDQNQVVNDHRAETSPPKEDHPKVGSNMAAAHNNGGNNKVSNAVHPKPSDRSVPHHVGNNTVPATHAPQPNPNSHVGNNINNTVLAAPVPQPNLRRSAEANIVSRDNGGTRYRNVQKDEEEDDDDEEE